MNYQKIHDQIINRAQLSNRKRVPFTQKDYVYYEKHHIIPKCLGGLNNKENLVLLTAREHFLIHWLLHRIYPEDSRIGFAFFRTSFSVTNNRNIKISSRTYKELKEANAKSTSQIHLGRIKSKEEIEKIRKTLTGIKHSQQRRDNLSKGRKGIPMPEEGKRKLSIYNTGKTLSKEHCAKISMSNKGRKMSDEQKLNKSLKMTGVKLKKIHCDKCNRDLGGQSAFNNHKCQIKNI